MFEADAILFVCFMFALMNTVLRLMVSLRRLGAIVLIGNVRLVAISQKNARKRWVVLHESCTMVMHASNLSLSNLIYVYDCTERWSICLFCVFYFLNASLLFEWRLIRGINSPCFMIEKMSASSVMEPDVCLVRIT